MTPNERKHFQAMNPEFMREAREVMKARQKDMESSPHGRKEHKEEIDDPMRKALEFKRKETQELARAQKAKLKEMERQLNFLL